jgi:AhpD family alkylhydroperoxidase
MKKSMGLAVGAAGLGILLAAGVALAQPPARDAAAVQTEVRARFGFVPDFIMRLPAVAAASSWEEMKTLQMNPTTALGGKAKELIGLAVASQIPCEYCIYAHTAFARLNGATDAEIGDAVAMAGLTRNVSTIINGIGPEEGAFRREVASWVAHNRSMMMSRVAQPRIDVVDARTAADDIRRTFGSMPTFLSRVPPEALVAMWRAEKDIELGTTSLDRKTKNLIGLAVAAQMPCRYCVIADTEMAKLQGVTDRELDEAVAMAGLVRNWSTLLNGMQIDKASFRRDVDRMVQAARRPQGIAPAGR